MLLYKLAWCVRFCCHSLVTAVVFSACVPCLAVPFRAGNDAFAKKDLDEALRLYSEVMIYGCGVRSGKRYMGLVSKMIYEEQLKHAFFRRLGVMHIWGRAQQ